MNVFVAVGIGWTLLSILVAFALGAFCNEEEVESEFEWTKDDDLAFWLLTRKGE